MQGGYSIQLITTFSRASICKININMYLRYLFSKIFRTFIYLFIFLLLNVTINLFVKHCFGVFFSLVF